MRTSIAPEDSGSVSNEPWLEIRRGRTRAPRREIRGRRFLIGAGSNCQLQLGGDMPILHSILLIEEDGAHIDAVVPAPQLMVNGRPQRSVDLQDGDVFTIGRFEFQVHVPQPTGALHSLTAPLVEVPESVEDLSGLSAGQLVALIETEQQQVATLAEGQRNGARALLDAVQRVAATAEADTNSSGEFVISFPQVASETTTTLPATVDDAMALTARRAS